MLYGELIGTEVRLEAGENEDLQFSMWEREVMIACEGVGGSSQRERK